MIQWDPDINYSQLANFRNFTLELSNILNKPILYPPSVVRRSAHINAPVFWQAVRDKIKSSDIETLSLFLVTNCKKIRQLFFLTSSNKNTKKTKKNPCIFHHARCWSINNSWVTLRRGFLLYTMQYDIIRQFKCRSREVSCSITSQFHTHYWPLINLLIWSSISVN